MWKFIRGKGQQPLAERQKLQKELFAYKKVQQLLILNFCFSFFFHFPFSPCVLPRGKVLFWAQCRLDCELCHNKTTLQWFSAKEWVAPCVLCCHYLAKEQNIFWTHTQKGKISSNDCSLVFSSTNILTRILFYYKSVLSLERVFYLNFFISNILKWSLAMKEWQAFSLSHTYTLYHSLSFLLLLFFALSFRISLSLHLSFLISPSLSLDGLTSHTNTHGQVEYTVCSKFAKLVLGWVARNEKPITKTLNIFTLFNNGDKKEINGKLFNW